MERNPFELLVKKTKIDSDEKFGETNSMNDTLECIFLLTTIKYKSFVCSPKPKYLYYIGNSSDCHLTLDSIDNAIFERIFSSILKENIVTIDNGYSVDFDQVIEQNPFIYLYNCFLRCLKQSNKLDSVIFESLQNSIVDQTCLYLINNRELKSRQCFVDLFNCLSISGEEPELNGYFTMMFGRFDEKLKEDEIIDTPLSYFDDFFKYFLNETFLGKLPPSSNALGIWKDPLQTLYCPERKKFVSIMSVLTRIPLAAMMILEFSIENMRNGVDYERCLLGRFLCTTHLPSGLMQRCDFFNKMPITIQEKHTEEQNIWQLLSSTLNETCELFMNIFKCSLTNKDIKLKLFSWFGQCINKNSGRNKLVHSLRNISVQDGTLASDGFFMNLLCVLYHLAAPLLQYPFDKIMVIQVDFTQTSDIISDLPNETRLVPMTKGQKENNHSASNYTALTQLLFLIQKCFQLGFHVIHGKFMELNQQLHQIQEIYDDLINGPNRNTPEGEQLKNMVTGQMSLYMSMNCAMRFPDFMTKSFAMVIGTCRLLVHIARNEPDKIVHIPEFFMDNIVDFVIYLRHFDDGFFETSGFSLDNLLEMTVLFMGSTDRVKNPHLRSRIPTLLECLIPQRDEQQSQGTAVTFYLRENLFRENASWTHSHIIRALFSAFTTMELSAGEENVRFEEKFEYRRPMYACLKFFNGKQVFDDQIKALEVEALQRIDDIEAPLCLKFLNLLVNDATFLLDEALNYLGQLKMKEEERISQGGRYKNQSDEASFQHMVMLTKYHNTLATNTIEQLSRMANLCPNIMIHPVLVDRIACTLNYFFNHLIGPKRTNLTVKDKEAYAFRPKQLVQIIAQIYVSLGNKVEFCSAVVNDGRSYSNQLVESATNVLQKVSMDIELLQNFELLSTRLKEFSANQNEEEENFEDAPEDYCDPIMGTIMFDPVILPSSGVTVDKKTIFRHLLSDPTDPFNRQPLKMSDVKPNVELKQKIHSWMQSKRH